jgi:hypothetical protein
MKPVMFTTGEKYGYRYPSVWERPYTHSSSMNEWSLLMLLEVRAGSDAHIFLSADGGVKKGYEIVIGASKNAQTLIRRGAQKDAIGMKLHAEKDEPLSSSEMRKFWISFIHGRRKSRVIVGRGWNPPEGTILLAVDGSTRRLDVQSASVCTGFGSEGEWSIAAVKMGELKDALDIGKQVSITTPPAEKSNTPPRMRNTLVVSHRGDSSGLLRRPRGSDAISAGSVSVSQELKPSEREAIRVSTDRAISKFTR